SGAVAVAAEGLADAGDDTDFALSVGVAPARGDLARVVGAHGLERMMGRDLADDLPAGDDFPGLPAVGVAHVHVFDVAHDVAAAAEMPSYRQYLVFIHPAPHDHVDFDRREARRRGGVDAAQHVADLGFAIAQLREQAGF